MSERPVPMDLLEVPPDDALALVVDATEVSYGELRAKTSAIRRAFASLDLPSGSVVAWVGQTTPEAAIAELATTSLDLVWCAVGARGTKRELSDIFRRIEPHVVLHDADAAGQRVAETVQAAVDDAEIATIAIGIGDAGRDADFAQLLDIGAALADEPPVERARTINRIQFTSGTEARPKAVGLSSVAMISNARAMVTAMRLTPSDRFLSPLPLNHAAGYCTVLSVLASQGALITQRYFQAPAAVELMRTHGCTAFRGVDPIFTDLLGEVGESPPKIRTGVISTVNTELRRRLEQAFGMPEVVTIYGMTESSGPATITDAGDSADVRLGTHGLPVPGMEVRVARPDADGVGEIELRGSTMMVGYLGDLPATARSCEGGWFSTGDRGLMHGERLQYLGRIKEIIRVGGENVACAEIESVLLGHPAVAQVVAFAVPHPRLDESVAVAIVANGEEPPDADEIKAFAKGQLASFKVPREVFMVDDLPRTEAGKFQRRILAAQLGGSRDE